MAQQLTAWGLSCDMTTDPEQLAGDHAVVVGYDLDPAVVEAAVKRMIADAVYPTSVDITADALKISMNTQIALGNLTAQPDYTVFVDKTFISPALAMRCR